VLLRIGGKTGNEERQNDTKNRGYSAGADHSVGLSIYASSVAGGSKNEPHELPLFVIAFFRPRWRLYGCVVDYHELIV
jgi:hypothetical protein